MTLTELIRLANESYPDEFLSEYFDFASGTRRKHGYGDSLAQFVVNELVETFDPETSDEDQIAEAIRVIENGARDLENVARGLATSSPQQAEKSS